MNLKDKLNTVRLDKQEQLALLKALQNINDPVFLFGSRLETNQKGGDIDLLVFSSQNTLHLSQKIAVEFFKYCEEKIDVLVFDPKRLTREQRAFLKVIKKKRIQ